MVTLKQLRLINLQEIRKTVRPRKPGEPRVGKFSPIKKFEIMHRPFVLNFRGKINLWLKMPGVSDILSDTLLSDDDIRAIRLYFYPQGDGQWLTQADIIERIKAYKDSNIRIRFVESLLTLWEKEKKQKRKK